MNVLDRTIITPPGQQYLADKTLASGASGILRPGINSLPDGLERYPLQAGGMIVLDLKPGDEIKVIDPEGLQACEVAVFDRNGASQASALNSGCREIKDNNIGQLLSASTENIRSINSALKTRNINTSNITALAFLEGQTRAQHSHSCVSDTELTCVIAAPAVDMPVDEQIPPTDLLVYVTRANPEQNREPALPEPLADMSLDLRVERCTSRAFSVKAGDYIQIIDVEGRECSDFQCFDMEKLDQGIERCLDATTTRTLMANAYPQPGLHAKFYDQDMSAMVEVIRDTCGRHDTFGLACTAKYYDDAGYPGHVNCSDNFNHALSAHDIAARPGWMAMNFFFNTGYDDHNQLFSDEPWSCLLYTSPSPRDRTRSRMPSSA